MPGDQNGGRNNRDRHDSVHEGHGYGEVVAGMVQALVADDRQRSDPDSRSGIRRVWRPARSRHMVTRSRLSEERVDLDRLTTICSVLPVPIRKSVWWSESSWRNWNCPGRLVRWPPSLSAWTGSNPDPGQNLVQFFSSDSTPILPSSMFNRCLIRVGSASDFSPILVRYFSRDIPNRNYSKSDSFPIIWYDTDPILVLSDPCSIVWFNSV